MFSASTLVFEHKRNDVSRAFGSTEKIPHFLNPSVLHGIVKLFSKMILNIALTFPFATYKS